MDSADLSIVTKIEKDAICDQFKDGSRLTIKVEKNRGPSHGSFKVNYDFALLKMEASDEGSSEELDTTTGSSTGLAGCNTGEDA